MSEPLIPRRIMLPPPGRPRWMPQDPAGAELLYLSWGARWMGDHPIPLAMHDGWVYALILEGAPTLMLQKSQRRTKRGDVFIFHPDCAFGWRDKPKCASRILTWLWRNPPTHSKLSTAPGGCWLIHLNGQRLHQLAGIHQQCLHDVGAIGEIALLSLRRARLDLDICLASALRRVEPANRQERMNMALHFLRHNPAVKQPVKSLCEHFNIAPATLRNLFQHHCRRSPQAVALEIRMHYARERLSHLEVSVKEVACELGYRHANDLSRAYKSYFGAAVRVARNLTRKSK